jgi:hypothetical protein
MVNKSETDVEKRIRELERQVYSTGLSEQNAGTPTDFEYPDVLARAADLEAKADAPHGSEAHDAEVVHDGDDPTLGSLNTDDASIRDDHQTITSESINWRAPIDTNLYRRFTSGSGVVSTTAGAPIAVQFTTGSTAGSTARGVVAIRKVHTTATFDKRRICRYQFDIPTFGENFKAAMGNVNGQRVAFRATGGDLVAVASDGTNETTATAISGASGGEFDLVIILDPDGGIAEYYANRDPDTDSPNATIDTNLPTGTSGAEKIIQAEANNPNGTDYTAQLFEGLLYQEP